MLNFHPQCEIRPARADSAACDAPILRVAGNGATSQFHNTASRFEIEEACENDVSGRRRKQLNAGKLGFLGAIDLLSARRLLYKSPRETEVERC